MKHLTENGYKTNDTLVAQTILYLAKNGKLPTDYDLKSMLDTTKDNLKAQNNLFNDRSTELSSSRSNEEGLNRQKNDVIERSIDVIDGH